MIIINMNNNIWQRNPYLTKTHKSIQRRFSASSKFALNLEFSPWEEHVKENQRNVSKKKVVLAFDLCIKKYFQLLEVWQLKTQIVPLATDKSAITNKRLTLRIILPEIIASLSLLEPWPGPWTGAKETAVRLLDLRGYKNERLYEITDMRAFFSISDGGEVKIQSSNSSGFRSWKVSFSKLDPKPKY